MAASTHSPTPSSNPGQLKWKSQWGVQVATDSRCLYLRESGGSLIAGVIFGVGIVAAAGWLGVSIFFSQTPTTLGEKGFGVLVLGVAAVFIFLMGLSLRRGRWGVVYDRGGPDGPAEIRHSDGTRLAADQVRAFSTRYCEGSGHRSRSTVVAELQDGRQVSLGPVEILSWAAHYSQQAANWMGLPFHPGT